MKVIYCKNCKFCKWSEYSSYGGDYVCQSLKTFSHNFYTIFETYTLCANKNKLNNCKNYKRLWYKGWIKE